MLGTKKQNINKNEEKKFENTCIEYLSPLYAGALRLTKNEADAEELVQDTYIKALKFKNKFEWGTNLKAWLFRIQINNFLSGKRRKKLERRFFESQPTSTVYEKILIRESYNYQSTPEKHVFSKFFLEELASSIDKLPLEYRIPVVLVDLQGFSYQETAKIIEIPIGTVMSRLYRARKILQSKLLDYAVEVGIENANTVSMSKFKKKHGKTA